MDLIQMAPLQQRMGSAKEIKKQNKNNIIPSQCFSNQGQLKITREWD